MVDVYIKTIDDNVDEFIRQVNQLFLDKKEELKKTFLNMVVECIDPLPPHYEWEPSPFDPPWDHSGQLAECGIVSPDITLEEFLDFEYVGPSCTSASYCSGCGIFYDDWDILLSDDTRTIGYDIMLEGIRMVIERKLNHKITDEELFAVQDKRSFDDIYDECPASDFFISREAMRFVGILDMTLSEILSLASSYC